MINSRSVRRMPWTASAQSTKSCVFTSKFVPRLHKWSESSLEPAMDQGGVLPAQSSVAPQRPRVVGKNAGRRGPEKAQLQGNTEKQTWDKRANEKMGSTCRGGIWSKLEKGSHDRRRDAVARVTLGIRQHDSHTFRLTSLPTKNKEPEEKEADKTQEQGRSSRGMQSRAEDNRTRQRTDGRSSVVRSLEHATSEEAKERRVVLQRWSTAPTWQAGPEERESWATAMARKTRKNRQKIMEILEVSTMHLGCEPYGTEWVFWILREWNAAADSLATWAIEKREVAFFLSSRMAHGQMETDRCGETDQGQSEQTRDAATRHGILGDASRHSGAIGSSLFPCLVKQERRKTTSTS